MLFSPRTLLVSIPIVIACLYFYYSTSLFLQIALGIFWILMLLGNSRVSAFSDMTRTMTKSFKILLFVIGIGATLLFSFIRYTNLNANTFKDFGEFALGCVGSGIIAAMTSKYFILYIICPLIILKKEKITTPLLDYYRAYGKTNRGNYIRFADDNQQYSVDLMLFQKFRKQVNVPVSYIKYYCPFGLSFIRKINIHTEYVGRLSEWETSSHTKIQSRIILTALIFVIINLVFLLIALGIARVLPFQRP